MRSTKIFDDARRVLPLSREGRRKHGALVLAAANCTDLPSLRAVHRFDERRKTRAWRALEELALRRTNFGIMRARRSAYVLGIYSRRLLSGKKPYTRTRVCVHMYIYIHAYCTRTRAREAAWGCFLPFLSFYLLFSRRRERDRTNLTLFRSIPFKEKF